MKDVIGVIMAGGRGKRLWPLTEERAKPAVPFGGKYRIIDFVMNNFVNSEIGNIIILTQVRSQSLNEHISRFWTSSPLRGQYIDIVPAQMKISDDWYKGTADAVFQNLDIIAHSDQYSVAAIFAGDHIFKMDVAQMYDFHKKKKSQFTISVMAVPVSEAAGNLGVIEVGKNFSIIGFEEKPDYPKEIPNKPGHCFVSMGNYLAEIENLSAILKVDAMMEDSCRDFGKDVIPFMLKSRDNVCAYDFSTNVILGQEDVYWRDVGTLDAYWSANMELIGVKPDLNLYDQTWPIWTHQAQTPPAKFVFDDDDRRGQAIDSMISGGCVISGSVIRHSLVFSQVRVNSYSTVTASLLLPEVNVARHCRITKAIIEKGCQIPEGTIIGEDRAEDEKRFHVSPGGVVLVTPDMLGQKRHYVR